MIFGVDPAWVATMILIGVYVLILTEWINRAVIAMLAAGLMIQLGILDEAEAARGIDVDTLALLTGMMLTVAVTAKSGLFQYAAIWSAKKARARPWRVMLMLSLATAVLSALLDNVTVVLLVGPVTLTIAKELELPAYPFLFAEVFASNIGGSATLIGDPPNILIGSQAGLGFNDFVVHVMPVAALVMAVQLLMTHLLWGRRMRAGAAAGARLMAMDERESIQDRKLLLQSLAVLAAILAAFVFADQLRLRPGTIAMFGAAVLMTFDVHGHQATLQSQRVSQIFNEVEWITIFFFIGLFVIVHGVEVTGILGRLARGLVDLTRGDRERAAYVLLWGSAVLSAVLDNIPFVATMIPVVKSAAPAYGGLEAIQPLWWALSLGACLGGNATLVGASANLTVVGLAERAGVPFRFWTYAAYAVPMTALSLAICQVYLWLRYF